MKFELEKPIEQFIPERIGFNYEELKSEIEAGIEKYKGMVVTEDGIRDAKSDRAQLNKLRMSIEDYRKKIKKIWNGPYASFEKQVKELVSLIDEPINQIDKQLKIYEDTRKAEKRESLIDYFEEIASDLLDNLCFEAIENPRWLNLTFKINDAKKEMCDCIDAIRADLLLLPDICFEDIDYARDYYFRNGFNIRDTKQAYDNYIKHKNKQKQENTKVREEHNLNIVDKKDEIEKSIEVEEEPLFQLDFRVWVTNEQAMKLKTFLKENNIKYGRVSK